MIWLLLFYLTASAKEVVVYRDHPVKENPTLEVLTYYDDENFIGYHTVVTERKNSEVKVVYHSKATTEAMEIGPQHSHAVFYAMHLQKTCQLLSQNESNSTDSDDDSDDDVWDFEARTVGLLYPIPEGCE